jgi:peptidyl-tRNA hydrolase, PTH1 family
VTIGDSPHFLIVGLGNPGERYARTRHNAGFMMADALASPVRRMGQRGGGVAGGLWPPEVPSGGWDLQCESLVCLTEIAGTTVAVAKPLTFMNLSGEAARLLLTRYGLGARDLILGFDDLSLPFGRIRVRMRGSSGGHRGLESVIRALETDEFFRVRLGIGEEGMPADKAEFVLSGFPGDREEALGDMIARAANAAVMIVSDGIEKSMSVFNAQEKEKQL